MFKSKTDRIIILLLISAIFFSLVLYANAKDRVDFDYQKKLFDDSYVHTIDLLIADPQSFFEASQDENYVMADVLIDNEEFKNVGLRAKGNNSLHLSKEYDLLRFSFKIEFDHFQKGYSYHGLDKLSLDASFQDNSYLKTKLTYDMFETMGVPTPLTSFAKIKINGQDWGLYLAIEEVEDSFLARNFGLDHGQLYKPDYQNFNDPNLDIALCYLGDDPKLYEGIFKNARTNITNSDQKRLINILKDYHNGNFEGLDIDMILSYFTVQIFCLNWDSYIGHTGHNYFLYEDDGVMFLMPWDYNLAYGTYAFGMSEPIKDSAYLINFPIDTPAFKEVMFKRPLYHLLMQDDAIFERYHQYFEKLLNNFFANERYVLLINQYARLIEDDVKNDPTAFCSFEDHQLALKTLERWCELRYQSIKGQLDGSLPSTISTLQEYPERSIEVDLDIRDLGDFEDLENCPNRERSKAILRSLSLKSTS